MEEIKLRDDFIKLGQALKAAGLVDSGVEAKIAIQDGEVLVNEQWNIREARSSMTAIRWNLTEKTIKVVQ